VYGVMGGLMQRYGGVSMPSIASYSGTSGGYGSSGGGSSYAAGYDNSGWGANGYLTRAFDTADALTNVANANSARLLQEVPEYLRKSDSMLGLAEQYADTGAKQSQKYYGYADDYLSDHKDLLANGTNAGLQNVVNEMNKSVYSGMQKTAGTKLSDWAKKGIINSSVATSGINDIENAAANAAAGNYGNVYNTMLANYLSGADTSRGLAESVMANANDAFNNYYNLAGSYRDNYNSGLEGLNTFAALPEQYYSNALAPLSPAYNYWKDSTNAWLANDKDYVATSDGK
ncbi:MAG: hypothetical protein Q4D58_00720, partial [Synergistaceae bacterium]|nr:hypothetical protein [Synergistaceae bacterium]